MVGTQRFPVDKMHVAPGFHISVRLPVAPWPPCPLILTPERLQQSVQPTHPHPCSPTPQLGPWKSWRGACGSRWAAGNSELGGWGEEMGALRTGQAVRRRVGSDCSSNSGLLRSIQVSCVWERTEKQQHVGGYEPLVQEAHGLLGGWVLPDPRLSGSWSKTGSAQRCHSPALAVPTPGRGLGCWL